jgi:hypothetical protein
LRKTNNDIKNYINDFISSSSSSNWIYQKGSNYGIELQKLAGSYYKQNSQKFGIQNVKINTNPNDTDADIVLTFTDLTQRDIEVKSCKDGTLNGVTICNSPHLLNDKDVLLINYTVSENSGKIYVKDVYETQLHRLVSINKSGIYKGCLTSTRDTGKKLKGRNFNDFLNTNEKDDSSLSELTDEKLIRKTILTYSTSKLIDDDYNFSIEEITEIYNFLKKEKEKKK